MLKFKRQDSLCYHHIPSQSKPFPTNFGVLHLHVKLPYVFRHVAFWWQLCVLWAHSLISLKKLPILYLKPKKFTLLTIFHGKTRLTFFIWTKTITEKNYTIYLISNRKSHGTLLAHRHCWAQLKPQWPGWQSVKKKLEYINWCRNILGWN